MILFRKLVFHAANSGINIQELLLPFSLSEYFHSLGSRPPVSKVRGSSYPEARQLVEHGRNRDKRLDFTVLEAAHTGPGNDDCGSGCLGRWSQ